jgi:hydrogenase maturation protease
MLSAPIILYDYPQVAAESAGDFYDSTEIDEMLTLRVLTLTDEEKVDIRESDNSRARQVLERTEALPWEHLGRVHGAVRGLAPIKDESLD